LKENINYPVNAKEGVFSREDKYRFHCWVNIDGEEVLCYMPSNFKFEKVYSIKGKMVLLSENTDSKSKFKYKVEAITIWCRSICFQCFQLLMCSTVLMIPTL